MTAPLRIVIGDTETSGLPPPGWKKGDPFPESYRCCEIAWIELDEHLNVLQSDDSFIDPECRIPAEVSKIHGITNKDTHTAPTLDEYAQLVKGRIDGPVVLVAHNAKFDLPFFEKVFDVQQTFCTLALARASLPNAKNHKLQTLRELLKVEVDGTAHRAMGDLEVLRAMLLKLIPGSGRDFRKHLDTPVRMLSVMPIGKFKGLPILSVPGGYRAWMLSEMKDMHIDLRYTLEQLKGL